MMSPGDRPPDPAERARRTWTLGDYTKVAGRLSPAAVELVGLAQVAAGERVLDVAAGNGNVALCAARRGALVTASDLTPRMVELGRLRADAEGVEMQWHEADAQALPWADATFDVALSCFGLVFAPDPDRAAAELARVVRPGGRIGLTAWRPGGLQRALLQAAAAVRPLPAGMPDPSAWGDEAVARAAVGRVADDVRVHPRTLLWGFPHAASAVDWVLGNFGGHIAMARTLDHDQRAALRAGMVAVFAERGKPGEDGIVVEVDYLATTAVARGPGR